MYIWYYSVYISRVLNLANFASSKNYFNNISKKQLFIKKFDLQNISAIHAGGFGAVTDIFA